MLTKLKALSTRASILQLPLRVESLFIQRRLAGFLALFLIICAAPAISEAATKYVRPGATGNNSGSDWANAYNSLPATLVRGDTYYLADGNYSGYTFNTANSGTTLITLKKATATDHGTDTGWSSTFGDGQATFSNMLIYTDYLLIDGQTRNSDWQTGAVSQYGITSGNIRIDNGGGTGGDNLMFRYMDIHGGGRDTGKGDDVIYGLTSNSNITFQYCALRDSDRTIFLTRGTPANWLVEYSYIARNASSAAIHGEIMSSTSSNTMVWRYNVIEDPEGTAVWAFINNGTATNWQIYGNIVFHSSSYSREGISGVVYVAYDASNKNTLNNLQFYNNTIFGIKGSYSGVVIQSGANNLVYNNIWYNNVRTNNSGPSFGSNWYYNTNADGDNTASKQTCTTNCNIFVDSTNKNFRLARATNAGSTLGSSFNRDMDGNARGADGVWDRGAYEFGGTTATSLPAPKSLVFR